MKYCRSCGAELLDEAVICPKCGVATSEVQAASKKNSYATAGFVLSIISLFITMYGIPAVLGLIFSIIGLIQCNKGNFSNKKLAVAGIIISAIAIVWGILYIVVIGPALMEVLEEILNSLQQY